MSRRCANNKLLCRWSKAENDLIFYFPRRCDGSLLHHNLCEKRREIPWNIKSRLDVKYIDSFVEELKKRGYDITTLRFEVSLLDNRKDSNDEHGI